MVRKMKLPGVISFLKALPICADAEGHFGARGALHVQKVHEFSLRRFGAEINFVLPFLGYAAGGFEHHIELADGGEVALPAFGAGTLYAL